MKRTCANTPNTRPRIGTSSSASKRRSVRAATTMPASASTMTGNPSASYTIVAPCEARRRYPVEGGGIGPVAVGERELILRNSWIERLQREAQVAGEVIRQDQDAGQHEIDRAAGDEARERSAPPALPLSGSPAIQQVRGHEDETHTDEECVLLVLGGRGDAGTEPERGRQPDGEPLAQRAHGKRQREDRPEQRGYIDVAGARVVCDRADGGDRCRGRPRRGVACDALADVVRDRHDARRHQQARQRDAAASGRLSTPGPAGSRSGR